MPAISPPTGSARLEVKLYSHLIGVVDTPDEFAYAVEAALAQNGETRLRRVAAMAKATWPEKVNLIGMRLQRAAVAGLARGTS